MTQEYSVAELMACILAREFKDGEIAISGGVRTPVVVASLQLARHLYVPNVVYYLAGNTNVTAPLSTFATDYSMIAGAEYMLPCNSPTFDRFHRGAYDFSIVGGMQVDKYGNLNLVCVGAYERPKVRAPGTTGLADITWAKRCFIWLNEHSKRVFVEKVDFVSFPGYLDGPGARERAGLKWGGIELVVSPLATMDFAPDTKRMRLKSVHPEVSVEQVVENTSFELIIPREVPQTTPPTDEELRVLRTEIDPHGVLQRDIPYG